MTKSRVTRALVSRISGFNIKKSIVTSAAFGIFVTLLMYYGQSDDTKSVLGEDPRRESIQVWHIIQPNKNKTKSTKKASLHVTKLEHTVIPTAIVDRNPATGNGVIAFSDFTSSSVLDSIRGTNITVEEILQNFARCREAAKKLDPECRKIPDNPRRYWRSTETSGFSQKHDFGRMTLATSCCAYNLPELMSPSPSDRMYPWEKELLSHGPLNDILDTAWASKSAVDIANKAGDKTRYFVGDEISFLVQLRTGKGIHRDKGGDHVRLWLKNDELGAAVTANVKDNNDGSYLATVKLPWQGQAVVMATIAQTRELFRSVLYVQRLFTSSYWITASFSNKKASEGTPCSPLPFVPGFLPTELCNFTDSNGGFSWYCGKPVKKELQCSDLESNIKFHWPHRTPVTKAEDELVAATESGRPFLIPTTLVINVEKGNPNAPSTLGVPTTECKNRRLETTFDEPMSTGYMYKKTWHPFACKLPNVDTNFANQCLKNTTLLLFGDSNSRFQLDQLHALTQCTHRITRHKVNWHSSLLCGNDKTGMSIEFYPHKHPFFGSANEHVTQDMLTSAVTRMDSIPSTGRYIVHLHHFLHLIPFHMSITENRLRLIRDAVARLLARNPSVLVVYQSVHAAYTKFKFNPHKMNIFLYEIHRAVFRGLGDRVMFFNAMDLTIATVNKDGHPPIGSEFPKIYLGHLCGRI